MTALSLEQIAFEPMAVWDRLHAEGGVAYTTDGWLIGTYDLVKAGLNERALTTAGALAAPFSTEETRGSAYKAFARFWSNAMVMQEGDRHAVLREALHAGARRINDPHFREAAQQKIASLIAGLPPSGAFDLVEKLAKPAPIEVIAELLGMPVHDLLTHSRQAETLSMFMAGDESAAVRSGVLEAAEQLWTLFASTEAKKGGLIDELRKSDLRPNQVVAQSILIFLAGHQTLRDAICSLVICLSDATEYQSALRNRSIDPARVIEETLRLESPVQVAARTAQRDLRLGSAEIRGSDRVLLCIGAANRDPQRFFAPAEFRADEPRPASIAFGSGPHTCWGTALAQLELRLVTQMLFERGRVTLAAPPVRERSLVFRKISQLEVQID